MREIRKLAVAILANTRPELREKLRRFRQEQTNAVLDNSYPPGTDPSPKPPRPKPEVV